MDTNVPIVANGRPDPGNGNRPPSVACREAAVIRLLTILSDGTVVLDEDGAIETEYRRHLSPRGEPGVGDRFYLQVLNSAPGKVERVALPKTARGTYADFPIDPELAKFD